jgi:anti-anti-sigma regulatory factor
MAILASLDTKTVPPVLTLKGAIDEDSRLLDVDISNVEKELVLDLAGISHINSVGIRSWINWIGQAQQGRQLVFRRCPRIFVMQMNMVADFLPLGTRIESFYVPYFCETCDEESEVLFTLGKDIEVGADGSTKVLYNARGTCKNPDCEIDIDTNEGRYFRFLSN